MEKKSLIIRLFALVAALACAPGMLAAEAYACYTSSNTTLTFYYDNQRTSRTGTTYDLNTGTNNAGWVNDSAYASVTKVVFDPSFASARPTTTNSWFLGMGNLQSITGMSYLNTSEVTNMAFMFQSCYQLTSIDLSSFNTSKVTDMSCMFSSCKSLTTIDLNSFNTTNVTDMCYMFENCDALTSLDVSRFNTGNVTDMSFMFENCYALTSLDVSSFNTGNVTDMSFMFSGCIGLTSLDLSSFNTSKVTDMDLMFSDCEEMQTIYVGNGWSTAAVTNSDDMFDDCTSLVGGQGTTWNSSNPKDKTYAHIDGGTSNPGYFTAEGDEP